MKILCMLSFALVVPVSAAEIRWTGSGTVSGVGGAGFAGLATVGDPVDFEMVYDTGMEVSRRSLLQIGDAFAGVAWFHGPANLSIRITIGGSVWEGEMPEVPASTNVMESQCWDFGGNPDWFKTTLDSSRGGTYPVFPYSGEGTTRSLEIQFRDDTSPANLFVIHQLPDGLSCLPQMTTASGAVRAGSDAVTFTLNPATVRVAQPQVPLSIARVEGGIELAWDTEDGKNYRLESTPDLKCWFEEGRFVGDGNPIIDFSNPFGRDPTRFFRVVEN